jgi:actin-related protein 8
MRFYKLHVTRNATSRASAFNESFKPEVIPDYSDPFSIDWITSSAEDVIIGEKVLRLADPHELGYAVRWPIQGGRFNTRDYSSIPMVLNDIETIIRKSLKDDIEVDSSSYKVYFFCLRRFGDSAGPFRIIRSC